MERQKRLGDAELEIMLAVWQAEKPVQSTYIHEKLKGSRDWPLPTVITSLCRLVEKGFLVCEKRGRSNWYAPLISESEYKAAEGRSILDRLYGGGLRSFAAALVDGGEVSKEELKELRKYLDDLEVK